MPTTETEKQEKENEEFLLLEEITLHEKDEFIAGMSAHSDQHYKGSGCMCYAS